MICFSTKILCSLSSKLPLVNHFSTCICPPPPAEPIVTLLDALSSVGSNLALLLKQNPNIKELRVFDEEKDPHGLVRDLCDIDTKTIVKSFSCKHLREAITGAHLVISTGGCQCYHGQNRKELFEHNLDNVRNAAIFLAEFNPTAIFCIATQPVEALVPMVTEEYKKSESYDPRKIIGITTPTSVMANTIIAKYFGMDPAQLLCPVIGGTSPKTIVPVVSQTRPNVPLDSKNYTELQEAISNAEEKLLEQGTMPCSTKSVGIARFVNLIVEALKGEKNSVECAFVAQTGHIGDFLPYMSSIVKLGTQGVESSHMPRLDIFEENRLRAAAPHILELIILGQTYLNGEFALPIQYKQRKMCDELLKEKVKECSPHLQ